MTDPQSGGSGSRSGSRKEGTHAERFIRREQPVTGYQKWWPSDPRERSEEPGFQLAAIQKVRPESEGCVPGVPCWHLREAQASGK